MRGNLQFHMFVYIYCVLFEFKNHNRNLCIYFLPRLKLLVMAAGKANQTRKYEYFMNQIWQLNQEAYDWLTTVNVRPEQWALCKDDGYRWGHISTNMAECFNNLLRDARLLPINACV